MPRSLMEVTSLSAVFLCLSSVLLCLQLGLVVLILSIFAMSFVFWVGAALSWLLLWGVPRPKLSCLLFELLLDFDDISVGCAQGWDVQKFYIASWSGLFSARNESGDIIKKCIEILQIFNNITEMYQRCNHKHKDIVIHNFLLMNENVQRL